MNPWLILGFVLAMISASAAGYLKGHTDGKTGVQAAWDAERIKQEQEHTAALQESINKQQKLQMSADQMRQEKDRELKKIGDTNRLLLHSLRERPERPAQTGSLSNSSQSCSGASGAQLARSDGEFLVGYATDAARVAAALDQCIKQYESVRQVAK
jgi:hypothetical protein